MTMLTPLTQYSTGIHFKAVSEVSNDAILIMPMIETRQGVENVEYVQVSPSRFGNTIN